MATRDGDPLNIVYVHVDLSGLTDTQLRGVRDEVRDEIRKHPRLASVETGVNRKADGSEAVVKIAFDERLDAKAWVEARGWASRILRVFRESEAATVRKLVRAPGWAPEEMP